LLFDLTPRALLTLAGNILPPRYRHALERFPYGSGIFKVDDALSAPIPWSAEECRQAGTVHVGGTAAEIAAAENTVARRRSIAPNPFVLLAQPTLSDPSRAPTGKHVAWAYCHTPSGSVTDLTERIETQIERFAPGFRDCILARHTMNTVALEHHNPNLIGGAVNGGSLDLKHLLVRPVLSVNPAGRARVFIHVPLHRRAAASTACAAITRHDGHCRKFLAISAARRKLSAFSQTSRD
jgi:phytoene dehydrogenase-like protein